MITPDPIDEDPGGASLDALLRLVAHGARRRLLIELTRTRQIPIDELPSEVAREADDERRIFVGMHHVHLPMLEAEGVVEVTDGTVTRGEEFESVRPLVEFLAEHYP